MDMAKMLVESMTGEWEPSKYRDDYNVALLQMIDRKLKQGEKQTKGKSVKGAHTPAVTNLLDILQESLNKAGPAPKKKKAA
jgi:DNA end-binding protein Ku